MDELNGRWRAQLQDAGAALLTAAQIDQYCLYLSLLARWNNTFNLTAVRDTEMWVPRHIMDSLAINPLVKGKRVLDVGTGAGLPGIPLAVIRPDDEFVLLDSNGKKTRFVRQAVIELGLGNCSVEQHRIESYSVEDKFDTITARAFSALSELVATTWHVLAPGGQIVAMKGRKDTEQPFDMPADSASLEQVDLHVPGEDASRHAVIIRKAG